MIPFDIDYLRPATVEDAVSLFQELSADGKVARFLSGGTELVTLARDGKISYDAVIDMKRIPEMTTLDESSGLYGAALRLTDLQEHLTNRGIASLIRRAAGGVADHTTRNSITLGGNICGMLPYRETILPFLVCDGMVEIAGPGGRRTIALNEVFSKRLKLGPGEILVSLKVPHEKADAEVFYTRHTRDSRIDYPLLTLCMAKHSPSLTMAVSGVFDAPVRSHKADAIIATGLAQLDPGPPAPARPAAGDLEDIASGAAAAFALRYRDDMRGSGQYRESLLVRSICDGMRFLKERQ